MGSALTTTHRLYEAAHLASIGQSRAMSHHRAAELAHEAFRAAKDGYYLDDSGRRVDWGPLVDAAVAAKVSIPPEAGLPEAPAPRFGSTTVELTNETTLGAARRLTDAGEAPLALNYANGIHPGGGWLHGALAQEEVLCRSSALEETLHGDPMYAAHLERMEPDSTDWVILSPDVPVFRTDDGAPLTRPWTLSFITSAAPVADLVGQPESGDLLAARIRRVLAVAHAYGYTSLVLGAWGCGAFANDPDRTASDFRSALTEFRGAFEHVVFGIPTQFGRDANFAAFAGVFSER
ncbi:MAG: TIGR02452 family protein [Actinomycetota bacterium]